MRFEEVLPALRAGKKVKNNRWHPENCIHNQMRTPKQEMVNLDDILSDGWEIIEPTVTITREQLSKALEKANVRWLRYEPSKFLDILSEELGL